MDTNSEDKSTNQFHRQRSNSDHLSPVEWCKLKRQMSFSRDYSHLMWHTDAHFKESRPGVQMGEQRVWFCIQFRRLCEVCLAMPLVGLVTCLVIALLFQFEHIHETACKVYNVVPSISAVTGISPGRYLWRTAIAFHLGPRLLIVSSYYHFLLDFATRLSKSDASSLAKLLQWCFYLQITEIIGLCGISFVHNWEHYPTHEKGFILYLTSSHLSFLLVLRIHHILWPQLNQTQKKSYRMKCALFIFSFAGMVIMGYSYYRHIIHCDNLAFSLFAFIEYWVAAANMAFYWTVGSDMPNEEIIVVRPGLQGKRSDDFGPDSQAFLSNGMEKSPSQAWQQLSYDVIRKLLASLLTIKHLLCLTSRYFSKLYNSNTNQKANRPAEGVEEVVENKDK